MIIRLGKTCRPLACGEGQSLFHATSCDPRSLISLLCLHLGVATPEGDRVSEANSALAACVRIDDFFHKSYSVDPIGVSRRILELIDEISLGAGVDFDWSTLSGPPRISQLARIAGELEKRLTTASLPTTIRRVIHALEDAPALQPVTRLILSEPRSSWPCLWRALFDALEARGTGIVERERIDPPAGRSDLSRVARKLLLDRSSERLAFADDQTIIRINGASVAEVSDATAAVVQSELRQGRTLTIVRSDEPEALDAALARQDQPVLGCTRPDRGGGPVEILPLMLDLASGSSDPATFLAFLNLEPNPLPSGLRRWLIRELDERPAVDPDGACSVVDRYIAKIDDDEIAERAAVWKDWLRVGVGASAAGTSAAAIEPVLHRIESWAEVSLAMPGVDDSVPHAFGALLRNVRSLRSAIAAVGGKTLTRIQLQGLTAQILSPPQRTTQREQSSLLAVDDASMPSSPTDTVIWWMAHDSVLPPTRRSFWTELERAALQTSGVRLQSPEIQVEDAYAAAMRLLTLATRRLILVTVDRIGDDPVAAHPLWYEIEDSFTEERRPSSMSVQDAWGWLAANGQADLEDVAVAPRTSFHATWEIPDAPYAKRQLESPSSLEKMLGCPLAWTLQYRAGLYDGASHGLADGFLLLGTLAHACFEEFFKSGASTLPPAESERAAAQIFDRCLRARAGILLTPGRDRERLEAQAKTVSAMLHLAATLSAGGWEFVAAEEAVEATDLAQSIRGRLDLLFRRAGRPSERLIVDVKYVGKRRRQQELQRGAAIQLATYSRILRAGDAWPKSAYYIVVTKDLLTVHGDIAPNLYRIDGETEDDVWSRIETAMTTTTARLAQGLVDVGIEDESPRALAASGRVAPAPCKYCDYRIFCRTDRRSA